MLLTWPSSPFNK